jgi:hypothetical protein
MFMSAHEWSVAGFGGRITDNDREIETALRYPGGEVTYRLGYARRAATSSPPSPFAPGLLPTSSPALE